MFTPTGVVGACASLLEPGRQKRPGNEAQCMEQDSCEFTLVHRCSYNSLTVHQ